MMFPVEKLGLKDVVVNITKMIIISYHYYLLYSINYESTK